MTGMKRLLAACILTFVGFSCNTSPATLTPSDVATRLAESADSTDRLALEGAIESLRAAERGGTITDTEAEALSALWSSAIRDGKISDDERNLLTSLVIELAASPEEKPEEKERP